MAASDIEVVGPVVVRAHLDQAAQESEQVLGYCRDGIRISFQHDLLNVQADHYGVDSIMDMVLAGHRCFIEGTLTVFDRSELEDFIWLYDNVGKLARIGYLASNLTGGSPSESIIMLFEALNSTTDWRFKNVAPLRIVQRLGGHSTEVDFRLQAIPTSNVYFDNTNITAAMSNNSAVEVAGAHVVEFASNDLGHTQEGVELAIEYQYEEVRTDVVGRNAAADLVVTGQIMTLSGELHSFDETQFRADISQGTYGQITNQGRLGYSDAASPKAGQLILDSELDADGFDWTFDRAILVGEASQQMSARHTIGRFVWQCLPGGASKRFYVHGAGS